MSLNVPVNGYILWHIHTMDMNITKQQQEQTTDTYNNKESQNEKSHTKGYGWYNYVLYGSIYR